MSSNVAARSDRLARSEQGVREAESREPLQRRILELLAAEPGTPSGLAEQLGAAAPSVSRVLSALRQEDLVRWYTAPGDGRVREYSLTVEGEVALRRHRTFGARPEMPEGRSPEQSVEFLQAALQDAISLRRRTNALEDSIERMFAILGQAEKLEDRGLALDTLSELVTTLAQDGRETEVRGLLDVINDVSRGEAPDYNAKFALPATAHYHYALGRLGEASGADLPLRAGYLNTAIGLYGDLAASPAYDSAVQWPEREAWGTVSLAQNLRSQSFFATSLRHALSALESFEKLESPYGRSQCLFLIGFCLRLLGKFEHAWIWLEEAHSLASENGFERLLADTLLQMGEVLRCRGEISASRERLQEALQRSEGMNLAVTCGFAYSAVGAVAYSEERWAEAEAAMAQAGEIFRASNHREGEVLNARREATLARRIAERERTRDLSSVEGMIALARGGYESLRSPAGITACEVELGWVRVLRNEGLAETIHTLAAQLDDTERRLLLELDPWVPRVLNDFAQRVEDASLVERSGRLLSDSDSRLDGLAYPGIHPSAAEESKEDQRRPRSHELGPFIAEMGGEARQEVEDGTEVLALA